MSDVNVLLCAVDSAMNMLAAFDRDRADVTAADLETVRKTATEANKAASDASAEIGGARDLAKQAGVKADTATTTAQNALAAAQARVLDITALAPVTVTRTDETAAITVAQATSSADGLLAAADKKKLDGIQSGANKYTLELSRLYATDEAISDGINFYDLNDFSLVICKPDKRIIYSQCRWSSIEEAGKLGDPAAEKVTIIARKRMEIAS